MKHKTGYYSVTEPGATTFHTYHHKTLKTSYNNIQQHFIQTTICQQVSRTLQKLPSCWFKNNPHYESL